MSGDVQPRKRKDKKKKKDAADDIQSNYSSEEIMHSHKDVGTGGNMCTKIIFYTLLGTLLVMIGIILLDQRGLTDLDSSGGDSQWAPIFQGWLEDPPSHEDAHLKTTHIGKEDHGDDDHEHDSGVEDEDEEHDDEEHDDEEHDDEEHDDEEHDDVEHDDDEEEENEDEHSGGDDEDEGLDDDDEEEEELDEDEHDDKKDEYSQEIDETHDEDSKEEDEIEEDDEGEKDDDDDEGEKDEEDDDEGENDDDDGENEDEIEDINDGLEAGDKSQEEDEEEEEEQGLDDDDDIEDNILFREIPGVVESSEDIEEGNANSEDLHGSSEDKQDNGIASDEKDDDQVRKMTDRTSVPATKHNANTINTARVKEPHITLQNAEDKKKDSDFKKPVEENKKKELLGVSVEKAQTLSKESTKQTSKPTKYKEKTEDQRRKVEDDRIVDSIKSTSEERKSETGKKPNTISEKVLGKKQDESDRGKASELNIIPEKPLRGTDNHQKEQDIRQQNYQKESEKAEVVKSSENKLSDKKIVNKDEKLPVDQSKIVSEKPVKGTDNPQKEQDMRQQNYQKVSEEAKTVSSSPENKLSDKKIVNKDEKLPVDQLKIVSEKPVEGTDNHQKEQDMQQQNYQKVSEEAKTVSSSPENKLSDKKIVNKAEKLPVDQLKIVSEKPVKGTDNPQKEQDMRQQNYQKVSEEAKTVSSSPENKLSDKKIVNKAGNIVSEKPLRETDSRQKEQDIRQQNYQKVSEEAKTISSSENKLSDNKIVNKVEKQPIDQKKKDVSSTNSPKNPASNEKEMPSSETEKESRKEANHKSTEYFNSEIEQPQKVHVKVDQNPISDNIKVGDTNQKQKTVVQPPLEINVVKKEGQATVLKLDKQDQKVSGEKAVSHDREEKTSNYTKTSSDKSELNSEKAAKQNSEKISEPPKDKVNKNENEKFDKLSGDKRDDSQQGKASSASDKAMGAEMVKETVVSQVPDKSPKTTKPNLEPDETEDKDENGDSGIEADESDTTGVALKFGVGVALVIVAHVVLVRKWNSDDDMVPPQTPTEQSPRISVEVPRIVETSLEQEDIVEDEPDKNIGITPELVVRRQTLLPEELAQSFENRKREDSASSGGTEEDIEDDGQEVRMFKMNVLSAELPVKEERSFKDEKPFKEDRMFKLESFEELMKKYRQLTPEGSDLEYDDEEEEEDGAELDEEEVDEEEEGDLEDEEENLSEETQPGKHNIRTTKKTSDHGSNSEEEEVGEDCDNDGNESKLKNEPEDDESEVEEEETEEDEEDEDNPQLFKQEEKQKTPYSKYQQNISDEEDTDEHSAATLRKFSKGPGGEKAQNYVNYDITNDDDWNLIDELDKAAAEKPEVAILKFDLILKSFPNSPRAWYGKATALDQLAEMHQSNHILEQAIEAFKKVVALGPAVKDKLLLQAAQRCIERMRFKGQHMKAVAVHQALISRFPNNSKYQNHLAVTYLMINRIQEAKRVLEKVLRHWKNDGFAQVHYGFILKTSGNNLEEAVQYLHNGIATREPGTIDGRFFFQLGDALHRLGRKDEAMQVYEMGVQEKLFLSKYQRSLYNVEKLRAQPWWTPEETTYTPLFNTLKNKWNEIKREGLAALYEKDINLFQDESENLKDSGKWQQLELYARGRKIQKNCLKAPLTCQLIDAFPMARDCKRGQVKFSVMHAGTHVWPHCGPTNCRLRSHLGLVVPSGTFIRVADEIRSWKEGDFIIFDDSFEHEVWHNGTSTRLVLIVDVWHPELTEEEKRTMAAI